MEYSSGVTEQPNVDCKRLDETAWLTRGEAKNGERERPPPVERGRRVGMVMILVPGLPDIQKTNKLAETTFQSRKIGGKSATKFCEKVR